MVYVYRKGYDIHGRVTYNLPTLVVDLHISITRVHELYYMSYVQRDISALYVHKKLRLDVGLRILYTILVLMFFVFYIYILAFMGKGQNTLLVGSFTFNTGTVYLLLFS